METEKECEILRQTISEKIKTMTPQQLKKLKSYLEQKINELG